MNKKGNYDQAGEAIEEMLAFFMPHCADQATLIELKNMASDPKQWRYSHALFGRIRRKRLRADSAKDLRVQWQYSFEEICAKTLFNLSEHYDPMCKEFPAPFDQDSPFWVWQIAIGFAYALGIEDPLRISSWLRKPSTNIQA